MRRWLALALMLGGCLGGASGDGGSSGGPGATSDNDPDGAFFVGLKTGSAQLQALCARGHQDGVSRGLCGGKASPGSLSELQHAVGLFSAALPPQFALTAHSTSLVARSVSAINPRAIIFTPPAAAPTTQPNDGSFVQDPGFVAIGFVRGEQL